MATHAKAPPGIFSNPSILYGTIFALAFFAISAAFSLLHKYVSSDAMSDHIEVLRREKIGDEGDLEKLEKVRRNRNRAFVLCSWSLALAASFLAAAAIALVIAIALGLSALGSKLPSYPPAINLPEKAETEKRPTVEALPTAFRAAQLHSGFNSGIMRHFLTETNSLPSIPRSSVEKCRMTPKARPPIHARISSLAAT